MVELTTGSERIQRVSELMDDASVSETFQRPLCVGVDLGTSNIQVIVVDRKGVPVAARFEWDDAVRDGVVVDYVAARQQLHGMLVDVQRSLPDDTTLEYASVGYPPGTEAWVESNVVRDAGLDVICEIDEPSASATSLEIEDGAIIDIGGGTTGISVIKEGDVVYTADEATGGHHLTLVLAGNQQLSFEEAEQYKQNTPFATYAGSIRPVIEKMASIAQFHLSDFPDIDQIYLVGGTVIPDGFEEIFELELNHTVIKPFHPILITPLGIALKGSQSL